MSYQNSTAEFRPELQVHTEQAMGIDSKFIADLIFPVLGVNTRTVDYMKITRGKGQLLSKSGSTDPKKDPLLRAPGTAYMEVTRTEEKASFIVKDRGLEEPMDDVQTQDKARFYDKEVSTVKLLTRNMRLSRESRVAAKVFDESIWGKVDATVAKNYAGSTNRDLIDFPEDVKLGRSIIEKRQEDVNTMVLSRNMWDYISGSLKLRQYLFGNNGGSAAITLQMLAEKFELQQILVGRASYDTTKPNKDSADANLEWIWGDTHFWLGNVQGGPPEMGGVGRTVILEDTTNGGQLFVTESYRDERIRSNRLRVRQDSDENTVCELGGLLVKIQGLE